MQNMITAAMAALASGPWCGASGWLETWRSYDAAARPRAAAGWAHCRAECGGFPCHVNGDNYGAPANTCAADAFTGRVPRMLIWGSFALGWTDSTPSFPQLVAGGSTPCEVAP